MSKIITTKFANRDINISKQQFCDQFAIDIPLLDKTIIQAILYDYIDPVTYDKIKERSINFGNQVFVESFFWTLESYRKKLKFLNVHEIYNELFTKYILRKVRYDFIPIDPMYKQLENEHKKITSYDFDIEENDDDE